MGLNQRGFFRFKSYTSLIYIRILDQLIDENVVKIGNLLKLGYRKFNAIIFPFPVTNPANANAIGNELLGIAVAIPIFS